jgi:Tol biopolymer transport system component/DNA-binding winged helix-turn-helix (wHTH) protein
MSEQPKHFYEFGRFRIDPMKRRLLRDGEPIPLSPKAFDTLLVLVQASGRTLEKDHLMQLVWPDAVVEENNLSQAISALRRALGDSRDESHYIATIPGLGYRFVADVNQVGYAEPTLTQRRGLRLILGQAVEQEEAPTQQQDLAQDLAPQAARETAAHASGGAQSAEPSGTSQPLPRPPASTGPLVAAAIGRHKKFVALTLSGIFVLAAGLAFWVYEIVGVKKSDTEGNKLDAKRLTRTGTTGSAAISPDGRYIVYSVSEAGRESVWLRQAAASSAQLIVPPADVKYSGVTFSRDGNHVFILRTETGVTGRALYRLAALGGVAAKVVADIDSAITLSPDGSRMAFVRNSGGKSALIVASVDGSNQRELATRPMTDYFKIPAWSPDGKVIACSHGSGEPYDIHNSVIGIRVEDGQQSPLTPHEWAWTNDVEWLPNGSGLLITARESHEAPDQIWHISYPGGAVRRLTSESKIYRSICLTQDAQTLLAVQTELLSDIWVAPDSKASDLRKITSGSGSYEYACFTPDGRIVYASAAGGGWDIWIMNADGSGQKQLTAEAGINVHQCVTPDGRYIVFASNRAGVFNIWRMDIDGNNPVQLTRGSGEKFAQPSPDGKWIIYNSVASDQNLFSLWRVSIEGGEPVQLTDGDTNSAVISPDGKRIAYFYRDESGGGRSRIAVIPSSGGRPEKSFDIGQGLDPLPLVRWFPDGESLTYSAARNDVYNIFMQPVGGGEAKQLTDFKVEGRLLFDWSRDGKQLVLTRRLWTADLVLVKDFAPKGF